VTFTVEYQLTFEEYAEGMVYIRKSVRRRQPGMNILGRILIGWGIFLGLGVMLFLLLKRGGAPVTATSTPLPIRSTGLLELILPFLPWIAVFGFVWVFIFRLIRGQTKRTWNQNPSLHRVRKMTVTDEGLVQVDSTAEQRTAWTHYLRFEETPNLFLLFSTHYLALIIPKRICTDSTQLNQFRSHLARNISGPTGAFPVIPLSTQNVEAGENELH
jgi:hypothetical protein